MIGQLSDSFKSRKTKALNTQMEKSYIKVREVRGIWGLWGYFKMFWLCTI